MSSLDLPTLVDSLRSKKVKQRNDAIQLLQTYSASKVKLTARQFVVLSEGLFKLIEIEREILEANPTITTQQRLSAASTILRDIIEESLKTHQLKFKHCTHIMTSITSFCFLSDHRAILAPCVIDFSRIVNRLLHEKFFLIHLSLESWNKCFTFLIKVLSSIVEMPGAPHLMTSKESVISNSLNSLYCLIGGDSSDIYEPLSSERVYFPLRKILRDIFNIFNKRESAVLVEAFKVTNKLLVSLSTEDTSFCHSIINAALQSLITFAHTTVDSLLAQLAIFINLGPFHRFLTIDHLPKLIKGGGDTKESCDVNGKRHQPILNDSPMNSQIYNLGVLAQAMLNRLISSPMKLNSSDVGAVEREAPLDCFSLASVELLTEKRVLWLLYRGTSMLLEKYYSLSNQNDSSGVTQSFMSSRGKRTKLQNSVLDITSFHNYKELLCHVISSNDPKVQIIGLQALALTENSSFERYDEPQPDAPNLSHIDYEAESTILDFHLGDDSSGSSRDFSLLTSLIKALNEKSLIYWALLGIFVILRRIDARLISQDPVLLRRMHQILKIIIPLIKQSEYSELSCRLFNLIILSFEPDRLHCLLDATIVYQLEGILDLAEISGPSFINSESIRFWWALHGAMLKLSARRDHDLSKCAGRWLLSKWGDLNPGGPMRSSSSSFFGEPQIVSCFIIWISGQEVTYHEERRNASRAGVFPHFCNNLSSPFERYVALSEGPSQLRIRETRVEICSGNPNVFASIIDKIRELSEHISNDNEDIQKIFQWTKFVSLTQLSLSQCDTSEQNDLSDSVSNLWRGIFLKLSSQEEFVTLLNDLVDQPINFPGIQRTLRQIEDFYLEVLPTSKITGSHTTSDTELDDEFSSGSSIKGQLQTSKSSVATKLKSSYFKFLAQYDNDIGKLLRVLEDCEAGTVVECLSCLTGDHSIEAYAPSDQLKLIRILGEGPLSSHQSDRATDTISITCRIVSQVLPSWSVSATSELQKDVTDLVSFLSQCERKSLFLTAKIQTEVISLLLECQPLLPSTVEKGQINESIERASNCLRVRLVPSINKYFRNLDSTRRMEFYRTLFESFPFPQETTEKAATYCYFFASVTTNIPQITIATMFNLLECSKFEYFRPYLKSAIDMMYKSSGEATSKALFLSMRLEILKSWWINGLRFDAFPHELFDYRQYKDFVIDNYRQLVSICLSIRSNKPSSYAIAQLSDFAKLKGHETQSLLYDSLPILIPLAYTSSGVRNEVFKVLSPHLNNLYKTYMREQVLLIILETIRLIDVGSEASLRAACPRSRTKIIFSSSVILDFSMNARVTPVSGLDLIRALIAKFWPMEEGDFWMEKVVYFFLRQLGKDLRDKHADEKIAAIRRIKLLLTFSPLHFTYPETTALVIDLCVPLLNSPLNEEALRLLSLIPAAALKQLGPTKAFLCVAKVLIALFQRAENNTNSLPSIIEASDKDPEMFGPFRALVHKAHKKLQGKSVEAVEGEISDLITEFNNTLTETESYIVMQFLTALYRGIVIPDPETTNETVAKFLLRYDLERAPISFRRWAARSLSLFYLKNSRDGDLTKLTAREELQDITVESVASSVTSMSFFVKRIVNLAKAGDYEEQMFAETILGAIVHRNESRKDETSKSFDSQRSVHELCGHIVPLDMHSCLLVVSAKENLNFCNESFASIIETFSSRVQEGSFESWASQLSQSILREIGGYTSLASLFATCVIRYPSLAAQTLPLVVCHYAALVGSKSVQLICDLIESMSQCGEDLGIEGIALFAKMVLSIRVVSKQGHSTFEKIYSNLNLHHVFSVLQVSTHSKTALMIFEDLMDGSPRNVEWDKWRHSMMGIFESIDDVDMLYGIPQNASLSNTFDMAEKIGSTSEVLKNNLASLDVASIEGQGINYRSTLDALLKDGLMGMSKLVSSNLSTEKGVYEWSWKLDSWDLPLSEDPTTDNELIFNYLKRVRQNRHGEEAINQSVQELFSRKNAIMRDSTSVRSYNDKVLRWFVALSSITEFDSILNTSESTMSEKVLEFQTSSFWFDRADVQHSENILLCRQKALNICMERSSQNTDRLLDMRNIQELCWQGLIYNLSVYNTVTRLSGHAQKMLNSAILMDRYVSSPVLARLESHESIKRFSTYSIAQTLWSQGNTGAPIAMLKSLINSRPSEGEIGIIRLDQRLVIAHLVEWLSASREELGDKLLHQYVEPVEQELLKEDCTFQRSQSFQKLARFCESQFKSKSLEAKVINLQQSMKGKTNEIEEIKSHYGKTAVNPSERKSVQKYYNRLKGQLAADATELESLNGLQKTFGSKSALFYLKALIAGDQDSESVDRFISLFLELAAHEPLQMALKDELSLLPSYKCISWAAQLMARLSNDESEFQKTVSSLIFKLCRDHPFHSLYMLTSLIEHRAVAEETSNTPMSLRVIAAERVREKLMASSRSYSENTLSPVEKMCEESISLAKIKSSKGRTIYLDKVAVGKFWLHDLPDIPPPILDIPVSKHGYDDIPKMVSVDPKVSIATSGLSLPKIIQLNLSDGSKRKMLLKYGTDDLRQDATMEQVFEKVNSILRRDRKTRKRNLNIKTYKAVPLGPKAGVIEFVPNSKALIEVVRPYHQKQDQMKYDKAKEMMKNTQSSNLTERIQTYEAITSKIKPVLHQYFSDHYLTPDHWYACRQRYTKGVATTSMVGHILGLGDRHCNNILLEESTGEPVHIDLGVAFDQGKRLPIPETVPFRLTRDIVDGFGFTGVHGAFDKSCEHTFRVLKEHKDHILAILDALRWDPLHSWSISPLRKKRLQDESKTLGPDPQEDGSEANAAMLTVIEKLDAGGLSVEATVRQLIKEATSVENLALIYCGWCPFY